MIEHLMGSALSGDHQGCAAGLIWLHGDLLHYGQDASMKWPADGNSTDNSRCVGDEPRILRFSVLDRNASPRAETQQIPRHPAWRTARALGRTFERVLNGMQTALFAYYASFGLLAFPLLANRQWVGGAALALVGVTFGSLLLPRLRPRKLKGDSERRPDQLPKVRSIDDMRRKNTENAGGG